MCVSFLLIKHKLSNTAHKIATKINKKNGGLLLVVILGHFSAKKAPSAFGSSRLWCFPLRPSSQPGADPHHSQRPTGVVHLQPDHHQIVQSYDGRRGRKRISFCFTLPEIAGLTLILCCKRSLANSATPPLYISSFQLPE